MNSNTLQRIIGGGERFEVIFARELPEAKELSEILFGLSILHAQGILVVGVESNGRVYGVPGGSVEGVIQSLREAAAAASTGVFDVNAVTVSDKWVAYSASPESRPSRTVFPGLTEGQEDILSALIREQRLNKYHSEVLATEDYENEWSLLLSGKMNVEDHMLLGEFEEIDLHALQEEGYITLLRKSHGYNLSLKRKAVECYERVRESLSDAPRATVYMWDLFVSHASEDKEDFVRPLVEKLTNLGLRVWYDEFTLKLGDSLRRSIDHGLANSRFGVVVVSPRFLAKDWPQRELNGLAALEIKGRKVILPVWHDIEAGGVRAYSPTLADRVAVSSGSGIEAVAKAILEAVAEGIAPNPGAAQDG